MDELLKVAIAGGSVTIILFFVLKIIQAAKNWKGNGHSNGAERLLITQIAASVIKISEAMTIQSTTLVRVVETNERFAVLMGEISVMIQKIGDSETRVTQKLLSDMETRLVNHIRNK